MFHFILISIPAVRTHLAMLGDLFQVVSQDILPAVAAGEALVQRLEVQVLGLQVAELGLYRLPLLDDDLEQSLQTGTVNRRGEGRRSVLTFINKYLVQVNIIIDRTEKVSRE